MLASSGSVFFKPLHFKVFFRFLPKGDREIPVGVRYKTAERCVTRRLTGVPSPSTWAFRTAGSA